VVAVPRGRSFLPGFPLLSALRRTLVASHPDCVATLLGFIVAHCQSPDLKLLPYALCQGTMSFPLKTFAPTYFLMSFTAFFMLTIAYSVVLLNFLTPVQSTQDRWIESFTGWGQGWTAECRLSFVSTVLTNTQYKELLAFDLLDEVGYCIAFRSSEIYISERFPSGVVNKHIAWLPQNQKGRRTCSSRGQKCQDNMPGQCETGQFCHEFHVRRVSSPGLSRRSSYN